MRSEQLKFTVIQSDIVWEDKGANLMQFEDIISSIESTKNIVVLPEMFTTGFSMAPSRLAEPMEGKTIKWMIATATKHRCILTGSLMIEENGHYFNRLVWVQPDGQIIHYDKRHLFCFAGEDKHYEAGHKRKIVSVNGWRINLQVCYDLRFPVWARNQGEEYDVLLYVANWPAQRSLAWRTLLQARAIENMCYVVGVNRVGKDGKNHVYAGESSVFGPLGEILWQHGNTAVCHTIALDKTTLLKTRADFPFLADRDAFLFT